MNDEFQNRQEMLTDENYMDDDDLFYTLCRLRVHDDLPFDQSPNRQHIFRKLFDMMKEQNRRKMYDKILNARQKLGDHLSMMKGQSKNENDDQIPNKIQKLKTVFNVMKQNKHGDNDQTSNLEQKLRNLFDVMKKQNRCENNYQIQNRRQGMLVGQGKYEYDDKVLKRQRELDYSEGVPIKQNKNENDDQTPNRLQRCKNLLDVIKNQTNHENKDQLSNRQKLKNIFDILTKQQKFQNSDHIPRTHHKLGDVEVPTRQNRYENNVQISNKRQRSKNLDDVLMTQQTFKDDEYEIPRKQHKMTDVENNLKPSPTDTDCSELLELQRHINKKLDILLAIPTQRPSLEATGFKDKISRNKNYYFSEENNSDQHSDYTTDKINKISVSDLIFMLSQTRNFRSSLVNLQAEWNITSKQVLKITNKYPEIFTLKLGVVNLLPDLIICNDHNTEVVKV